MTKWLNLDLDNTLGGNSPSDVTVSSQKAIKEYVDTEVDKKQDKLIAGKNVALLDNYTVLDYIATSGTQYINTGYVFKANNGVLDIEFAKTNPNTQSTQGWGSYSSSGNSRSLASYFSSNGTHYMQVGNDNVALPSAFAVNTFYHLVVSANSGTVKVNVDGTEVINTTYSGTIVNGYSWFLGALNNEGSPYSHSSLKVRRVKLYDNDKLVRDLIPCKDSNNVVGMYDTVTQTFFTNSGTGSFVAGDEVHKTIIESADFQKELIAGTNIKIDSDYTVLEYIEGTGTQYIDTGINAVGASSYGAELKYAYPSAQTGKSLIGAWESDSYSAFGQPYTENGLLSALFIGKPNTRTNAFAYTTGTIITDSFSVNVSGGYVTRTFNGATSTASSLAFSSPTTLTCYLFAVHRSNGANQISSARMYYAKLYKDNVLVFDGVPVKRNSDNAIGMYDAVTKTFFGNSGSGTFIAGPVGNKQIISAELSNSANTDLSNLTNVGKNISNWSTNLSNAIAEMPNDIKVSFSGSTLTLKSGSELYMPNGSGTFTKISIASDVTATFTNQTGEYVFTYNYSSGSIIGFPESQYYSGANPTFATSTVIWYNTASASNIIRDTTDGGATWSNQYTFPFVKVKVENGTITSILQVYDGVGYIGSSFFILPGIKTVVSNGRNTDGSLKSTYGTKTTVTVQTNSETNQPKVLLISGNSVSMARYLYVSPERPNFIENVPQFWYNPETNIMWSYTTSSSQGESNKALLATANVDSDKKIVDFAPRKVFRAVDYNDLKTVARTGDYDDLLNAYSITYDSDNTRLVIEK